MIISLWGERQNFHPEQWPENSVGAELSLKSGGEGKAPSPRPLTSGDPPKTHPHCQSLGGILWHRVKNVSKLSPLLPSSGSGCPLPCACPHRQEWGLGA